jgi:hypothetical protein
MVAFQRLTGVRPGEVCIDVDELTYALTQPGRGRLTGTAPHLVYAPDANYRGTDTFTFKASDGRLYLYSNVATVTITMGGVAPDAFEPNDTQAPATDLRQGQGLAVLEVLTLHRAGNDDFFRGARADVQNLTGASTSSEEKHDDVDQREQSERSGGACRSVVPWSGDPGSRGRRGVAAVQARLPAFRRRG